MNNRQKLRKKCMMMAYYQDDKLKKTEIVEATIKKTKKLMYDVSEQFSLETMDEMLCYAEEIYDIDSHASIQEVLKFMKEEQ